MLKLFQTFREGISLVSRNSALKSLIMLTLATSSAALMATPASAATWYVSLQRPVRPPDGKSWASPWPNLDRIDWTKVQPGDVIKIDAGYSLPGYNYVASYRALKIQKDNVKVEVSTEEGHNANVVWIEGSASVPAIDIGNYKNVQIRGTKWLGSGAQKAPNLSVIAYNGTGVNIASGANGTQLHNMQIHMCNDGIKAVGGQTYCYNLRMNNNLRGVSYAPAESGTNMQWFYLNDSWIHNDTKLYTATMQQGTAWYPRNCAGIVTSGEPTNTGSVSVSNSILGPGLSTSVDSNSTKCDVSLNAVLSINPSHSTYKIANVKSLSIRYCTSFLTPLNKDGQANTCFSYPSPKSSDDISGSIFYGGGVSVNQVPSYSPFRFNTQFKTSGNTLAISPEQKDPKFMSDVSAITGSTTFGTLRDLNFKPGPGSPVLYAESWVYPSSVAEFLNRKQ